MYRENAKLIKELTMKDKAIAITVELEFNREEIGALWHTGFHKNNISLVELEDRMEAIGGDDDKTNYILEKIHSYKGDCSLLWCDSYLDAKIVLNYFKKISIESQDPADGFILWDTLSTDYKSEGHVVWLNKNVSEH
jgi:hypothetical protein